MDQQLVKDNFFFSIFSASYFLLKTFFMSFSALLSFFFVYIPFNERSFARKGLSIARLDFQDGQLRTLLFYIYIFIASDYIHFITRKVITIRDTVLFPFRMHFFFHNRTRKIHKYDESRIQKM